MNLNNEIHIVIADDHALIATGFINTIKEHIPGAICRAALSLSELHTLLQESVPDILFQDVRFGDEDARDFMHPVLEAYPDMKVVIISSLDDQNSVRTMMRLGASGYVVKSDPEKEIVRAIIAVLSGDKYLSEGVRQKYSERAIFFSEGEIALTPREKEVLKLIGEEYSTREIASSLSLSEKSIENYRSNLLLKFDAKNVAGLIKKALMEGFL